MLTTNPTSRYYFTDAVAALIAIRDAEHANLEAVLNINTLLDYLCNGVDSENEVEFCLACIRGIEQCTSVRSINPFGIDDLECPWANELLEIEEKILDAKKEITGADSSAPVDPFFAGMSFGPEISDEEIPF